MRFLTIAAILAVMAQRLPAALYREVFGIAPIDDREFRFQDDQLSMLPQQSRRYRMEGASTDLARRRLGGGVSGKG